MMRAKGCAQPIAVYIDKQIAIQKALGKTRRHIAEELGYDSRNMISMFRTGDVKVPLAKIPALARALDADPAYLMQLAVQQYWPNEAEALAVVFGTTVTKNEVKIIELIREITNNEDPALTLDLAREIKTAFK